MKKLKTLLTALALVGLAVAPSYAQGVERAQNVVPFITSDSWFRTSVTGTCAAPQFSATVDTDSGTAIASGTQPVLLCDDGSIVAAFGSGGTTYGSSIVFNSDNTYDIGAVGATRPRTGYFGTDVVASRFIASTGTASTSGYAFGSSTGFIQSTANGVFVLTNAAGTDFSRLQFGGTTSSFPALKRSGTGILVRTADDSSPAWFVGSWLQASDSIISPGSGTGITVNATGQLQRAVYKVTIASTAFTCAALTCDVTIGTLPVKTNVLSVYGEMPTAFACASVCTSSTLSMTLGSVAGGAQFLASLDADAVATVFGDADAELGTALARASAIQGGNAYWTGAPVSLRLTSGTGNIGTGAATNLSQGSITFWLVTERMP